MRVTTAELYDFQELWVGLDLAKKTFDAVVWLGNGKLAHAKFPTSQQGVEQLLAWCDQIIEQRAPGAQIRFVMEATGSSSVSVFTWLYNARPQSAPAIINPFYIKSFGQSLGVRNKTDKADAIVIARYGHERRPAGELPKSPEFVRLQKLVREREAVIEERTAEKNRAQEPCDVAELRKMRQQRIAMLDRHVEAIDKLMLRLVKGSAELKRDVELLDTVPGVGFTVAVTVLAELGDLRRFDDPRKLVAYAGLSPRECKSGTSVHRPTRLSKQGNKRVRPMLHLAARALIGKTKYAYGRLYQSLIARGKTKRAALAAISRRILVLMRAVLISNNPYCDQTADCGKQAESLGKTSSESACAA